MLTVATRVPVSVRLMGRCRGVKRKGFASYTPGIRGSIFSNQEFNLRRSRDYNVSTSLSEGAVTGLRFGVRIGDLA